MIAIISTRHGHGLGAEAVLEQCLKGWQVSYPPLMVVAPPDSHVAEVTKALGLSFVPLASTKESLIENLRGVHRLREALVGCELVHAWTVRSMESALLLSRHLGIPASATLHDHPHASFLSLPRQALLRWSAQRLTALVCVSEAVREACRNHGIPGPLEVIRNGLVDSTPNRSRSDVTRVGFLGMYADWKGFEIVEKWIRATHDLSVCWHLYGNVAPIYEKRAQTLADEYPGRIFLRGRLAPEQIFSETDILVHASTSFDPLPTVLLEAARAGIPSIASTLGGASEIVMNEQTGFLFDPQPLNTGLEALRRLITDENLRASLGVAARHRYEEFFTVTRMTEAYAHLWRRRTDTAGHKNT